MGTKDHWNKIYQKRNSEEFSWYQAFPVTSLELIKTLGISYASPIADIGGGDSLLSKFLIEEGYNNITVLDISENAIQRAKDDLGNLSGKIKWVVTDILDYLPEISAFVVWHDRAAFHFLKHENEIKRYVEIASAGITQGGYLIISTFSENGPDKCSGLEITQYSAKKMEILFRNDFELIKHFKINHLTPSNVIQNFLYCVFIKK